MKITLSYFFAVINTMILNYDYAIKINDECKTLFEVSHKLQNCCIRFDEKFKRATYFLDHKKYKKLRKEFNKSFCFFIKKIKKIILATQHKNKSIRDEFVEKIKGNKGKRFINFQIHNFLSCIISYNYSLVMIQQSVVYHHNIIRDLRNTLDLLENRLNKFKEYLIRIKNK
jgi:hypothetical protein